MNGLDSNGNDTDEFTRMLASDPELNLAIDQCKQGVILANTDVFARMKLRAALAHNNITGPNALAAKTLYAESTTNRIAAVTRTATCFFRCHCLNLSTSADAGDLHFSELLAMSKFASVVFPALELHASDLLGLAMPDNLGRYLAVG